jgi:hypothetical protein
MLRWKARVTHRDPTFKAPEEVSVPEESVSVSASVREETLTLFSSLSWHCHCH